MPPPRRSARRGSPPGCRCAGGPGCSPANAWWCSARVESSVRSRSAVAQALGAGRVVAVCRSEAAAQRAIEAGADDGVVLGRMRTSRSGRPADRRRGRRRSTSSSIRSSASRPPRRPSRSGPGADWSTWAERPTIGPSSRRPPSGPAVDRHPRLHEQRHLRRAASRCADFGAGPGRPGPGGRRPPGHSPRRLRAGLGRGRSLGTPRRRGPGLTASTCCRMPHRCHRVLLLLGSGAIGGPKPSVLLLSEWTGTSP